VHLTKRQDTGHKTDPYSRQRMQLWETAVVRPTT